MYFFSAFSHIPGPFVVAVFAALIGLSLTTLVFYHASLIALATNTHEAIRNQNKIDNSPYSRGICRNIMCLGIFTVFIHCILLIVYEGIVVFNVWRWDSSLWHRSYVNIHQWFHLFISLSLYIPLISLLRYTVWSLGTLGHPIARVCRRTPLPIVNCLKLQSIANLSNFCPFWHTPNVMGEVVFYTCWYYKRECFDIVGVNQTWYRLLNPNGMNIASKTMMTLAGLSSLLLLLLLLLNDDNSGGIHGVVCCCCCNAILIWWALLFIFVIIIDCCCCDVLLFLSQ